MADQTHLSIWKKDANKHLSFELYDSARSVLSTERLNQDCYAALGVVTC